MEKNRIDEPTLADAARGAGMVVAFQPIVDLDRGTVGGFEALARFGRYTPDVVFGAADADGVRQPLELMAVEAAVAQLDRLPSSAYLSVNVSPDVLVDPSFEQIVLRADVARIVIEVTEHAPTADYEALGAVLARLRGAGARLAIDDVGAGFSSLSHILRLKPDVIKLDISFTRHIHLDPDRRMLVASLVAFAHGIGATVVAEGIELGEEASAMLDLGVRCGQGYLYGKASTSLAALPAHPAGRFDRKLLAYDARHDGASWGMATHVSMLVEQARTHDVRTVRKARHVVRWLLPAAMMCSLLFGGTTVALAQDAEPAGLMWHLRLKIEDARLLFASDRPSRDALHARFAQARLDELEAVGDDTAAAEVAARLGAHLRRLAAGRPGDVSHFKRLLASGRAALRKLDRSVCATDKDACEQVRAARRSAAPPKETADAAKPSNAVKPSDAVGPKDRPEGVVDDDPKSVKPSVSKPAAPTPPPAAEGIPKATPSKGAGKPKTSAKP